MWVSHLLFTHMDMHMQVRIHKDIGLVFISILYWNMLLPTLWGQRLQIHNDGPSQFSFHQVCSLSIFRRDCSSKWFQCSNQFSPRTRLPSYVNGINMLEIPRPQCQRDLEDNGHYNAFSRFFGKKNVILQLCDS